MHQVVKELDPARAIEIAGLYRDQTGKISPRCVLPESFQTLLAPALPAGPLRLVQSEAKCQVLPASGCIYSTLSFSEGKGERWGSLMVTEPSGGRMLAICAGGISIFPLQNLRVGRGADFLPGCGMDEGAGWGTVNSFANVCMCLVTACTVVHCVYSLYRNRGFFPRNLEPLGQTLVRFFQAFFYNHDG